MQGLLLELSPCFAVGANNFVSIVKKKGEWGKKHEGGNNFSHLFLLIFSRAPNFPIIPPTTLPDLTDVSESGSENEKERKKEKRRKKKSVRRERERRWAREESGAPFREKGLGKLTSLTKDRAPVAQLRRLRAYYVNRRLYYVPETYGTHSNNWRSVQERERERGERERDVRPGNNASLISTDRYTKVCNFGATAPWTKKPGDRSFPSSEIVVNLRYIFHSVWQMRARARGINLATLKTRDIVGTKRGG